MKKKLFDLTIEEFTRVLLDYEKVYEIDMRSYHKNGDVGNDTLLGTYQQLYDASRPFEELNKQIIDQCFDYEIEITTLDTYNYLAYITKEFCPDRTRIVIGEMELFYSMFFLEDANHEAELFYIERGIEIPYIEKINKITGERYKTRDYDKMRSSVSFREASYHSALYLLKSKLKENKISSNKTDYNENTTEKMQFESYFSSKYKSRIELLKDIMKNNLDILDSDYIFKGRHKNILGKVHCYLWNEKVLDQSIPKATSIVTFCAEFGVKAVKSNPQKGESTIRAFLVDYNSNEESEFKLKFKPLLI